MHIDKDAAGPEGLDLPRLIVALGGETFFESAWERSPVVTPVQPWLVDEIGPAAIEGLIASLGTPDRNWIQLVRDGKGIASAAFTNGEGFVDLQAVRQAFADGYTVQLSKIQVRHAEVGAICRAFEGMCLDRRIDLMRPVGSHLYVTPPHRRGLLPHYDDHNVLVLQLAGTKHWRLYHDDAKPIGRQVGSVTQDGLPPLTHEIELRAGQILYMPRGCYHEASTSDAPSTHLTLDVYAVTLMDVLQRAVGMLPGLGHPVRQGLSAERAGDAAGAIIAPAMASLDFAGALRGLRRDFRDMLYALPGRGLHPPADLDAGTVLHHRPGMLARASTGDGGAVLEFVGGRLDAGADAVAAFRFVADHPRFAVSALPLGSDAARIGFAQTLVESGLVDVAWPDGSPDLQTPVRRIAL